jgi:hypothetical protein
LRKKCCASGTPAYLFVLPPKDKTCKNVALGAFNTFYLYKYQDSKNSNDLNFADTKKFKKMGKDAVQYQSVIFD